MQAKTREEPKRSGLARANLMHLVGDYWIVGVLIAFLVIFAIIAPGFLTLRNWLSTSVYAVQFILLAIGETFVIITSGIDLSVGSVMGLSGMVAGYLMRLMTLVGYPVAVVITLGLLGGFLAGMLVGIANGFMVAKLNILPLIATLGTLSIARGLTFVTSDVSIAQIPEQLGDFCNHVLWGVFPTPVLITLVICVLLFLMLHKTRFGRYTFAIGSNREGARLAGVNIQRHLIKIYAISAGLASITGLITLGRFTAASPLAGNQLEMNAIAAAIIGGVSLFGGRGTIIGSVAGAIIVAVLVSAFVLLNIEPYWQMVATGAVLIVAVYVDQQRHNKRFRRVAKH